MMNLEHITWAYFLRVLIVLIVLNVIINGIQRAVVNSLKRKLAKQKTNRFFRKLKLIYLPLSLVILILIFVLIDYKINGIILLASIVFFFPSLKNYFSGLVLQFNPLLTKGAYLITKTLEGEIQSLNYFGINLKSGNTEQYLPYSNLHSNSFKVDYKIHGVTKKIMYLQNPEQKEILIDSLFSNPLVDFSTPPIYVPKDNGSLQIEFSLEEGAQLEQIIDYLHQKEINVTSNTC